MRRSLLVSLLLAGCPALEEATREAPPPAAPAPTPAPPPSAVEPAPAPPAPIPAPRPIQAGVEVAEGEADAGVREVVREGQGQVRSCYERTLRESPAVKGRIALDVTIAAGQVAQIAVAEDTTGDPKLAGCIQDVVRRWTFDPAINDTIHLPFSLQQQ